MCLAVQPGMIVFPTVPRAEEAHHRGPGPSGPGDTRDPGLRRPPAVGSIAVPTAAKAFLGLAFLLGVGAGVYLEAGVWLTGGVFVAFLFAFFAALIAGGLFGLRSLWQRQRQQVLSETEERLQLSQRIARIGTWDWDVGSDRVTCSDQLCRILNVAPADAPITYAAVLEHVHASDRTHVAEIIERCLESGALIEAEHRLSAPGEAPCFVRLVGHVYRDDAGRPTRVIATVHDITEQKLARLALLDREARLREIFDNMGEGFLRVDLDGKVLVVNPAALVLLGYDDVDQLVGKDLKADIYVDPADHDHDRAYLLQHGRGHGRRVWWKRQDGSQFMVQGSVRVLRHCDGTPAGFEGIFRDITAQNEYEAALRRSKTDLAKAQQLARVGRWHWDIVKQELHWQPEVYQLFGVDPATFHPSRDSYIAMIHPDDRDLVSTRWGRIEADVPVSRDHRIITPGGAFKYFHLEAVVERDPQGAPLRIAGIIQDVTDRVCQQEQLGALMAALPDTIVHTDAGGIVRDVHAPTGRAFGIAAASMAGQALEASLPLDVWRKLYPVLASAGTNAKVQTTECWVDASLGHRQCLEVRVAPVRDGGFVIIARDVTAGKDATELLSAAPRAVATVDQPLAGLIVLVVEDNEINRLVVQEMLEGAGAVVETACDGTEAVHRFAARGEIFDAVLMDIAMPSMDGYQATRAIRRDDKGAVVPIIATTAHVFTSEVKRCLAAGMNDHIGKPIDPDRLITTLRNWTRPDGSDDPRGLTAVDKR
jgi:PAS domain S-box-containing protein